jgi:hypothetical protein
MNGYMNSQIVKEISESRGVKKMTATEVIKLRMSVKEIMWKYYSENRSSIPDHVPEFREEIIIELMKGESVEVVFGSYGEVANPPAQLIGVAA